MTVKGPKGQLTHSVAAPIEVAQEDGTLLVTRPDDERTSRALHGLTRTLVANMVTGVTQGYEKKLEIVGTGYRVLARGLEPRVRPGVQPPDHGRAPGRRGLPGRGARPGSA